MLKEIFRSRSARGAYKLVGTSDKVARTRNLSFSTASASQIVTEALKKGFKQPATSQQGAASVISPVDVPEQRRPPVASSANIHASEIPVSTSPKRDAFVQPYTNVFAPKIVVVGVGGAGGNAVNNMISRNLQGVEFLVCNTDAQHLSQTLTDNRVQMGSRVTAGLGCGANPQAGRLAAEESLDEIMDKIGDANMVFITAGMGGGTGTGSAPVIAQATVDAGILTVAVATKPFRFEGQHRRNLAEGGLTLLSEAVDTMIVIPNQNLFRMADERTSLMDAFRMADDVLLAGVKNVTDLMVKPGLINLDFADVQSVMRRMGYAMMGSGEAEGEDRAILAAEEALSNPLLGDLSVESAQGMLVNITGGPDMTLLEVDRAAERVTQEVEDSNANIIFGSAYDSTMEGRVRVSVVATGVEVSDNH